MSAKASVHSTYYCRLEDCLRGWVRSHGDMRMTEYFAQPAVYWQSDF
jgi:hypothetical protein